VCSQTYKQKSGEDNPVITMVEISLRLWTNRAQRGPTLVFYPRIPSVSRDCWVWGWLIFILGRRILAMAAFCGLHGFLRGSQFRRLNTHSDRRAGSLRFATFPLLRTLFSKNVINAPTRMRTKLRTNSHSIPVRAPYVPTAVHRIISIRRSPHQTEHTGAVDPTTKYLSLLYSVCLSLAHFSSCCLSV
jgi:hypothetical protein